MESEYYLRMLSWSIKVLKLLKGNDTFVHIHIRKDVLKKYNISITILTSNSKT